MKLNLDNLVEKYEDIDYRIFSQLPRVQICYGWKFFNEYAFKLIYAQKVQLLEFRQFHESGQKFQSFNKFRENFKGKSKKCKSA